jgi:hypothetical protein
MVGVKAGKLGLKSIRDDIEAFYVSMQDKDGAYGAYRTRPGGRCDLYASTDVCITRAVTGEDLRLLPEKERNEWINHINSFADDSLKDGSYSDNFGHSRLHTNGMVIGALGLLEGKQKYPCKLYEPFDSAAKVGSWLAGLDWVRQWSGSHLFWGGMHCFSFSRHCTAEWKEAARMWLLENIDEASGFWRRGTQHADRHQGLGGFAHIYPVFQHHSWDFPCLERTVDSILAMQLGEGNWLLNDNRNIMSYLDLDALYVLKCAKEQIPRYRKDALERAVRKYLDLCITFYQTEKERIYQAHPHYILAVAGIWGLFQSILPDIVFDDRNWSDIFSDIRLYATGAVEV